MTEVMKVCWINNLKHLFSSKVDILYDFTHIKGFKGIYFLQELQ